MAGNGPGCVKSHFQLQISKFDLAGCRVSDDRLSGRGQGTPRFGDISTFDTTSAAFRLTQCNMIAHGRRMVDRQMSTRLGHTGKCLLRDRSPEKQPFRINDQAQLWTSRAAGWPSAAAPLGLASNSRSRQRGNALPGETTTNNIGIADK